MKKVLAFAVIVLFIFSCAKKTPPPTPFVAETAFSEANAELGKKRYEEARKKLEDIKLRDAGAEYAPLAQLRIADSYYQDDEAELAVNEYREFLDDYPKHKYTAYAQHQIGLIYFNMISGPDRGYDAAVKALSEFEKLMTLYPRNPYRESVLIKIERCREVMSDHEFMVGGFYFKSKSYNGALGRLLGLLKDYPGSKNEAEALYMISVSFKGIGEDAKSEEYFSALAERYPNSPFITKAEKELRKIERKRQKAGKKD